MCFWADASCVRWRKSTFTGITRQTTVFTPGCWPATKKEEDWTIKMFAMFRKDVQFSSAWREDHAVLKTQGSLKSNAQYAPGFSQKSYFESFRPSNAKRAFEENEQDDFINRKILQFLIYQTANEILQGWRRTLPERVLPCWAVLWQDHALSPCYVSGKAEFMRLFDQGVIEHRRSNRTSSNRIDLFGIESN